MHFRDFVLANLFVLEALESLEWEHLIQMFVAESLVAFVDHCNSVDLRSSEALDRLAARYAVAKKIERKL